MTDHRITQGKCSGCHACANLCPRGAIAMQPDGEGFLYPHIDDALCVDCDLCRQVCPVNHPPRGAQTAPVAYAAIHTEDAVRENSSSGGVFSRLAQEVLSRGGAVYGAAMDTAFRVVHTRTETDYTPLRTSKYVQSRMGDVHTRVAEDLNAEKPVLFTGTPCQVAGLYNYLQTKRVDTTRLYLADLICHGVPSPAVWEKHLAEIAVGRTPHSINFRDKSVSWGGFSLKVAFTDGSEYKELASVDAYMRGFFANLTLRPSCADCAQKTVERVSDLTLADCWGIDHFLPAMNDGKGTSAVLVYTDKGAELLDACSGGLRMQEVPTERVLRYNRAITVSATPHPRRALFFSMMAQGATVADAVDTVLKPTLKEKIKTIEVAIKRWGKRVLRRAD